MKPEAELRPTFLACALLGNPKDWSKPFQDMMRLGESWGFDLADSVTVSTRELDSKSVATE